jgi:hypothetical protein
MILLEHSMQRTLRTVLTTAVVFTLAAGVARADRIYVVRGDDSYSIGPATQNHADIFYAGTEHLSIVRSAGERRYVAEVTYTRTDEAGKAIVHARFVQDLESSGDFIDRTDDDPDFLTVLNQPFAVQLDPTTMEDLTKLHGSVPFKATSPLGGAQLRGLLRSTSAGIVGGARAIGVRFQADGPMSGSLPEHPGAVLAGRMHIDGVAYYAATDALLVYLDATLTIEGSLQDDQNAIPVRIVYRRTFSPARGER